MKRLLILGFAIVLVLVAAYASITFYDHTMPVGRMWETPAVRPNERPQPDMPKGVVPINGGEILLRSANQIPPPPGMDLTAAETLAAGQTAYNHYCRHCHGPNLDGQGTVGQSFAPLPANLLSDKVQNQSDTALFKALSYGSGRAPDLSSTVAVADRWAIIAYIRGNKR